MTVENRQNRTSGKHTHSQSLSHYTNTHSRFRLGIRHTVKTSAVSFTKDCLLGTVYLQYLSHSLLLCSAAMCACEKMLILPSSISVLFCLIHVYLKETKSCKPSSITPPLHLPLPCHFLSLSCPRMAPHPPWLPWR